MMTAMVAAVMPTVMSKTVMAAMMTTTEANVGNAVTVAIESTPPMMAAMMPVVTAEVSVTASNLLNDAAVLDRSVKSGRCKRCRI